MDRERGEKKLETETLSVFTVLSQSPLECSSFYAMLFGIRHDNAYIEKCFPLECGAAV